MSTVLIPKLGAVGTLVQSQTDASGATVLVIDEVEYPLLKIKRASGILSGASIASGGTTTGLQISAAVSGGDPHGLIDLINEHINVPSDAVGYTVTCQGVYVANATGGSRTLEVEGWVAGVVWVVQAVAAGVPHASAPAQLTLAPGQIAIAPASIPKLRFATKQDSGGNLTITPGNFTIEFYCA